MTDDLIRRGDARKVADEVFDRLEKKGAEQAAFGAAEVCEAIAALPATPVDALMKAAEALAAVLNRHLGKGPIPDVEMMLCWMAAQDVRAALAAIREGRK